MATWYAGGTGGGGSPKLYYELYYDYLGGSGNTRTFRITAGFKTDGSSSSWYGYPCSWRTKIQTPYEFVYGSWQSIKGSETWRGSDDLRWFAQDITIDVRTSSAINIRLGFETTSDASWKLDVMGDNISSNSTNVPPVISGTVSTSLTGTIPENTSSITVTSPIATDANGNLAGYRCRVSVNYGGYIEVYRGSSNSFTHNVSAYGEGTVWSYIFDAYDSYGEWSGVVYSSTLTKNSFVTSVLDSSSNITFDSTSLNFTYSAASNTNGNTTFTRTLTCDNGINIYNNTISAASPITLTVYKTGTLPTTPYIKFDDIKNVFSSSAYKGSLTFTLITKNAYNSSKNSSKVISVNLQTNPNPSSSCSIATDANSTAYLTVTSTSNKYFIPDGSKVVRVNWTSGSGKLGETITYDLYVAYGSGSWSLIASNLAANTLYYNHVIPKQSISVQFKYMIRVKTDYGLYSDTVSSAQTLHYYNVPSLTPGAITRTSTSASVIVTIKSNSSIPNINTVGTWIAYNKGTTTQVTSGTLTQSQNEQTVTVNSLVDNGQYDLKITFKDDTGFSVNTATTLVIGANQPIYFINKYGVGVGGAKADSSYNFVVGGKSNLKDDVNVEGNIVANKDVSVTGNETVSGKLDVTGNITAGNISQSATANTIVQRTSSGYINATYFNSNRGNETSAAASYLYDTGDGFLRKKTLDNASGELAPNSVYRQALINGNFDIWQRSRNKSISSGWPTNKFDYVADRWWTQIYAGASGGNVAGTVSRQDFTNGQTSVPNEPKYYFRLNFDNLTTKSADALIRTVQRIEDGLKIFAGKKITFGIWLKSSVARNVALTITGAFGSGGSPSPTLVVGGKTVGLTTSWQLFTLTADVPSISGKTFGTNNDSYLEVGIIPYKGDNSSYSLPSGEVGSWSGGYIDMAQASLNVGSVLLPFMPKSFQDELRDCMRYFEKSYNYQGSVGNYNTDSLRIPTTGTGGNRAGFVVEFKVPKRTTPTVKLYSDGGNGDGVWDMWNGSSWLAQAPSIFNVTENQFHGFFTWGSFGYGTGTHSKGFWIADSEL